MKQPQEKPQEKFKTPRTLWGAFVFAVFFCACTGSFEEQRTGFQLLVALVPNQTVNCQSQDATAQASNLPANTAGILSLSSDALIANNAAPFSSAVCARALPTGGEVASLLGNAARSLVYASVPSTGKVLEIGSTLAINKTFVAPTGGFCPSTLRFASEAQLVVLDDPRQPGCATPNRTPRLMVYAVATPNTPPVVVQANNLPVSSDQSANIALEATSNAIVVLWPFAGVYRYLRFPFDPNDPSKINSASKRDEITPITSSNTTLASTLEGSNLILGASSPFGGRTIRVPDPGTSTAPVFTNDIQADGTPLATTFATFDPANATRNTPSTLVLAQGRATPNRVLLQQGANTRALEAEAQSAAFTQDRYLWLLGRNSLFGFNLAAFADPNNTGLRFALGHVGVLGPVGAAINESLQ